MGSDLRITVHFLQPYSHGRGEDGSPEWPPSPLRLFQALVAAASRRRHAGDDEHRAAVAALEWLERQAPPEIVAPPATPTTGYRLYVPDNVGDRVAQAWSAGRAADIAGYRTEKDVAPVQLEGDAVHYVYRDVEGVDAHLATLRDAARSMTHVGWGIDMVAGDASLGAEGLPGERWIPGRRGGTFLRSSLAGTYDALERRHSQFLNRLDGGVFRPVAPLTTFVSTPYARSTDPEPRAFAAFRLVHPWTGDHLALDPTRRARDVAAWIRHAAAQTCEGWPFGEVRELVHGHDPLVGETSGSKLRFSYLPLPTITPHRVEAIARVIVVASRGLEPQMGWLRTHLAGQELVWEGEAMAVLDPLPASDWVLRKYVDQSSRWSTVTPVVLPGHDDRSDAKGEKLLRKAFLQAGLTAEVVDEIEELDWRPVGFRPGLEHASRYALPDKVHGPRYHVRVRFRSPIVGPLAVGSGRHRGLGVFAAE